MIDYRSDGEKMAEDLRNVDLFMASFDPHNYLTCRGIGDGGVKLIYRDGGVRVSSIAGVLKAARNWSRHDPVDDFRVF